MEWFNIEDKIPRNGDYIVVEWVNKKEREKIKQTLDYRWYDSLDLYATEYYVFAPFCSDEEEIENLKNKYESIKWSKITLPCQNKKIKNKEIKKISRFELMEI